MPRSKWFLVFILALLVVVTGCGMKSEADIVEDLTVKAHAVDSYRSHATMTIQSGKEKHEYAIEVWYQPPHYYRVALKNTGKDVTQIILRNDEGVFVLTPKDDKYFSFQSNWPDEHGQPYLYQTLLNSIVGDESRTFEKVEDSYIFDVAANYKQNQMLKRQRIQLNKKYSPEKMSLLDADGKTLVDVSFEKFESDVRFDDKAFDMKRNMDDWGEEALAGAGDTQKEAVAKVGSLTPAHLPQGTKLESEQHIRLQNGEGIVYRYSGEHPFTLLERPANTAIPTIANSIGEPVQLGDTVGVVLHKGEEKELSWTNDGVEFQLRGALAEAEMVQIAESLQASK